jgi:segregation and condensation protein A
LNAQPQTVPVPSVDVLSADTHDGLALLVNMAQNGDIDPWNVDLVQVADQYLQATQALQHQDGQGHIALRLTGKTLLYLAILLRMKSDLLAGYDPFAVDELLEDASFDELTEYDPNTGEAIVPGQLSNEAVARFQQAMRRRVGSLQDVLERRTSTKQPRIRPVTLDDLIRELKKYEILEQERSLREKVETIDKRRVRTADLSQLSTEEITQLAHEEFQQEMVDAIRTLLEEHLPATGEARLSLTDLCDLSGYPPVVCFLALLFLEASQEVEMHQTAFYSDEVWVAWQDEHEGDLISISPVAN